MTTNAVVLEEIVAGFSETQDKAGFDSAAFTEETLSDPRKLASVFDHTILKPDATREQVIKVCEEAVTYRFACAMVNPCWASLAYSVLAGSGVPLGVVIGFPLGASLSVSKRDEAAVLVRLGTHDLDMVINLGMLKAGMNAAVQQDIRAVVEVAHEAGAIVKVILETGLLTVEEKLRGAALALAAGADFLKTSTGFAGSGATAADVALLRGVAGTRSGVKASGGIRSLADTRAMLSAGANRIGASASVSILRELGAALAARSEKFV